MKDSLTLNLFEQPPYTGAQAKPDTMIEEPAPDPQPIRPTDWNPDEPLTPCIESDGYQHPKGYRYKQFAGKLHRAHRLAWIQANGDIPPGLQVRHICGNRLCINVDHLRLGTARENRRDALVHGTRTGGLIEDVRAVYNQALFRMKYADIAKLAGVVPETISKFAAKRGLSRRRTKLTPPQRDQIARRFSAGERADHLAAEFGVTIANVRLLARTRKLPKPLRRKWRASINLSRSLFE